jgi:hypothetical protein
MKTIFKKKILNKIHVFTKFQIETHGWTLPNVCSRRRRSINYTSLDSSRPYESIEVILEVIRGQLENSTFFDLISRISIRALFNK